MTIRESFDFVEGEKLILSFEKLLQKHGINVAKNSELESDFLSVFDVLFHYDNKHLIKPDEDSRSLFRDFSALYDLSLKIIKVKNHKDFKQLIPHLKKLNVCSVAQNKNSKITDQEANKIIELYLATLCMELCDDISLDHPESSKGDNPDIIAKINEIKWGFACKTIHTRNSQTLYENIVKAIDQIEKSESEIGIPVINLKNIISHDDIWPNGKSFQSVDEPLNILLSDIDAIRNSLLNDIGVTELKNIFIGKKSLAGVLFIAHSASSVFTITDKMISPTATRINAMSLFNIDKTKFTEENNKVFESLNHHMQLAN